MLLTEFDGTASYTIDAAPDAVFAFITSINELPTWNACIHHVIEHPGRPLAEGVEWVVQMRAGGARWPSRSRVLLLDPADRRFEHTSRTDDDNPSLAVWSWHVTAAPNGTSLLTVGWVGRPKTYWRRLLFARWRRSQLGKEVPTSLHALADQLSDAPAPARRAAS